MPRVPKHTHDATYAQRFHEHDELSPEGHGVVYTRASRQIISGDGLTGGGDLTADRTLVVGAGTGITVNADDVALSAASIASLALADSAVQPARQVISGGGLTGGGDLSADRTLAVGAGTGITVNADDVAIDQSVAFIWTNTHIWEGTAPSNVWKETDAGTDEKRWAFNANGASLNFFTQDDAGLFGNYIFRAFRTGTTVDRYEVVAPLQVDSLHTAGVLIAGIYTPTITNVANVDSSSALQSQYLRVGNTVTVSGSVTIDPTTSATTTTVRVTLPIASALTSANQLAGVGADTLGSNYALAGDATNDEAFITSVIVGSGNRAVRYTFTYEIA